MLSTSKFLPIRFILLKALIKLSAETETFIPILKHFLEIYQHFDPNQVTDSTKNKKKKKVEIDKKESKLSKKGKKESLDDTGANNVKRKPLNLDVTLKVTKEQTFETEFAQKVIEKFYELLLYYLQSQSGNVAFPEMVAIFLHQSRKFVKSIRFQKERNQLKQLLDKVAENSDYVFNMRKNCPFGIGDQNKIVSILLSQQVIDRVFSFLARLGETIETK